MDYTQIGLKCGLEIHNRLSTQHKLFCECPARFSNLKPYKKIERKLRAVPGELGQVDVAAAYEALKNRKFVYQLFSDATCLVEMDCEPPHPLNIEALIIALQIAKLLKAKIPEEIHVMRKTVIDGSNTAGFQRTAIIGTEGVLETSLGKITITNISLEEEAAGIVKQTDKEVVYRLDRLGIPLIEIGTSSDIKNPEHAKEVAEKLGMIIRSTGKSQRGIGVTRQDVNISIKGGARVEIKGVQELDALPKIIENEIKRQQDLMAKGEKPKEETRIAKPDSTTEFTRPLPGSGRMYPETDIPPIVITSEFLKTIKVPETWEDKAKKFSKIIPRQMAEQILRSEWLDVFEQLSKKYNPVLVANTLTSTLKDLKREGLDIQNLKEEHLEELFSAMKENKIAKEALPEVLSLICKNPQLSVSKAIEKSGLKVMTQKELTNIIQEIIKQNPQLVKKTNFQLSWERP